MTGVAPEVRSDKSLALLTFDVQFFTFYILHMTFDIKPMDRWTNGPMDQLTNALVDQ